MNVHPSSQFTARLARACATPLLVIAALTLTACGGGDEPASNANVPGGSAGRLNIALSATPTAMSETAGPAPLAVTFMAMEPKGAISTYEWDFKDNSPVKNGPSVDHTFTDPGTYTVTLTVKDAKGDFNRASVMVSVNEGGACAQVPVEFSATVWPAMSSGSAPCSTCHAPGRVASGSALVFVLGGTELQNYNVLRNYARTSSDTLLSKVIGGMNHTGGAPFVNANSPQYKALTELVPVMKQACTASTDTPVAAQFWSGVSFASDATVLAKAAVLFAGRNPTVAETAAVANGGTPVLRSTIRDYMKEATFDRFLDEAGDTHFLPRGVTVFGNNMGLNATDLPSAADVINNTNLANGVRNRFQTAVQREPIELMKYIVKNDRPWTDMTGGKYTVVNPLVAQYMTARVTGTFTGQATDAASDMEYLPAVLANQRLPGDREHAGVLSTHAWLQRFPTTPTNRNRHRVYIMAKQFLATDVAALAARPIDDGGNFRIPTMENAACSVCHTTIDPMAAGFQNWNEANRYLPNRTGAGKDHALPGAYRANNYPRDAANQRYYVDGDNWFRDQHAPGYAGTPMPGGVTGNPTALQWLGDQVAADSRFAMGAVHFWYKAVFNREPMKAPLDQSSATFAQQVAAYNAQQEEFKDIAARFATNRGNGAYNVKDLLADLVMSRWYKAEKVAGLTAGRSVELADVGSQAMLNPAQVNRKLLALTGRTFSQFNNALSAQAQNYGNFDGGLNRNERANEYTMVQTMVSDRMMSEMSCGIVQADFNKATATRILFADIALTDTPANAAGEAAIQQKIKFLHNWLLKEDLAVTDAEVQRTYALFRAVWSDRATPPTRPVNCAYNNNNDPNYTGRAWSAVIAYMIGDSKFLFE